MKKKLLTIAMVCFFVNTLFAQKENNIWYFGFGEGIDFNSGVPVAINNSSMSQDEGCSVICDGTGALLFYTDGISVWDRLHNQMPNGSGLLGGYSATQSALIVPFPGNNSMYYIFTVEQVSQLDKLSYSVVDMALNSGNGDVTVKNQFLRSPVTEKLCGVKHSNGIDYWIMVHGHGNDSLFAFQITSAGVSTSPVVSKIGPATSGNDTRGYMKFSADGTKLAFAAFNSNYVDLFDFNSTTGIVSNEKYLTLPVVTNQGAQGLEFSISGQYLYTCLQLPVNIYQWDISSNSAAIINGTLQQIGTSSSPYLGAMQMAPDGKIYIARYGQNFLDAINSPEMPGTQCNFVDNAFPLNGSSCHLGLPNFIASYFLPTGINTNDSQQNQLTIYPNPAADKIFISLPVISSQIITTKIFSITGEVIFTKENRTDNNYFNQTINVSAFSNGIYFLSVRMEKEMITRKIVVQH